MNVLVMMEMSGRVRDAFIRAGHYAISCDILASESDFGPHSRLHWWEFLEKYPQWDLMIAHPPCTYLTLAGQKWFYHPEDWGKDPEDRSGRPHPDYPNRRADERDAIAVAEALWSKKRYPHIKRRCLENPRGMLPVKSNLGPPTQVVQPWWFGDAESKALCLWEDNLPPLVQEHEKPAKVKQSTWLTGPKKGVDRSVERSRTFLGFADALARQWGSVDSGTDFV